MAISDGHPKCVMALLEAGAIKTWPMWKVRVASHRIGQKCDRSPAFAPPCGLIPLRRAQVRQLFASALDEGKIECAAALLQHCMTSAEVLAKEGAHAHRKLAGGWVNSNGVGAGPPLELRRRRWRRAPAATVPRPRPGRPLCQHVTFARWSVSLPPFSRRVASRLRSLARVSEAHRHEAVAELRAADAGLRPRRQAQIRAARSAQTESAKRATRFDLSAVLM